MKYRLTYKYRVYRDKFFWYTLRFKCWLFGHRPDYDMVRDISFHCDNPEVEATPCLYCRKWLRLDLLKRVV